MGSEKEAHAHVRLLRCSLQGLERSLLQSNQTKSPYLGLGLASCFFFALTSIATSNLARETVFILAHVASLNSGDASPNFLAVDDDKLWQRILFCLS